MSYLVKDKDKVMIRLPAGHWEGLQVVEVRDEPPIHRWTGPKRTIQQWRQVLSFFEWTQATHKSEALVYWMCDGQQWGVVVPPQRGQGMTVKVVEDHPNYQASFQQLPPSDWERLGTDHHHCSSSAFQSGTDHQDETQKEGLHLTVGGLGSGKPYGLHARACFRHLLTDVCLGDWFELPEAYRDLPAGIQLTIQQHLLLSPTPPGVPGVDFPQWWADNYLPYEPQRIIVAPTQKKSLQPISNYTGGYFESLKGDIREFCAARNMAYEQFLDWIDELRDVEGIEQIVDMAVQNWSDLQEMVVAARSLSHYDNPLADQEAGYQRMFD